MAYQPKSYRKFLATSVATALVATAVVPAAVGATETTSFTDLDSVKSWDGAEDAIAYLVEKGAIQGPGDGTFNPTGALTRVAAAEVLAKALDLDLDNDGETGFADVPADHWGAKAIKAVKEAGIVDGVGDGTNFNPSGKLTRAALAKMVVKAYGLERDENADLSFTDVQEGAWYADDIMTLASLGIIQGAGEGKINPNGTVSRASAAIFVHRAVVDEVRKDVPQKVAVDPAVESVSAINAAELVVTFNKAVKKSDVVDSSDNLVTGVFTRNGVGITGAASLSEDGKQLTITGSWEGTYLFELVKNKVNTTAGEKVPAFAEKVSYSDKVAPTFVSVTAKTATESIAKFSEPIYDKGTVTAKLADGTDVSSLVGSQIDGNTLKFNLSSAGIEAGKTITITVAGLLDYASNLVEPNPITFQITKGKKDGIAPEVTDIRAVNAKKFELKFSEPVLGLQISDIRIGGSPLVGPGAKLTQDKNDTTKYYVTVPSPLTGLQTISVDAESYTDYSLELGKAASKIVNFGTDLVEPALTSALVTKNKDGKEVLTLTFSEDVELNVTGTVALPASEVKDYVTSSKSLSVLASKITAVTGDATKFEILLENVSSLSKDGQYIVDLPAGFVKDTAGNPNKAKAKAFTFTRTTDAATAQPTIDKTIDITESKSEYVTGNGIKVVDNNTFQVQFVGTLDNATVVDKNNYRVSGATVSNVSLNSSNLVTVTLENDSNNYSGKRNITISGIKTKAGVVMDSYTTQEYLFENVRPVITKVELASIVDATTAVDAANGTATVTGDNANKVTSGPTSPTTTAATVTYVVNADGNGLLVDGTPTADVITDGNGSVVVGGVTFTLADLVANDTFTITTTAGTVSQPATSGSATVQLTFSEAISNGVNPGDDFELYIKGEKVTATVTTGTISSTTPNKVVLTINKGLTITDFNNGIQFKAASSLDITDAAGNKLYVPAALDLKLN